MGTCLGRSRREFLGSPSIPFGKGYADWTGGVGASGSWRKQRLHQLTFAGTEKGLWELDPKWTQRANLNNRNRGGNELDSSGPETTTEMLSH